MTSSRCSTTSSRVSGCTASARPWGTGTLLHAACAEPGRFAGLVLVTPPTAWETRRAQSEVYEWHAALVERQGRDAFVSLGAGAPQPPALVGAPATEPSVTETLLPAVLRGAAASDLPGPEAVAALDVPTLVLAWRGDPSHPTATAQRLHELVADSRLVVASSPADVRTWPGLVAGHVGMAHSGCARGDLNPHALSDTGT